MKEKPEFSSDDIICLKCKKDGWIESMKFKKEYWWFCAVHTEELLNKINNMIEEWIKNE